MCCYSVLRVRSYDGMAKKLLLFSLKELRWKSKGTAVIRGLEEFGWKATGTSWDGRLQNCNYSVYGRLKNCSYSVWKSYRMEGKRTAVIRSYIVGMEGKRSVVFRSDKRKDWGGGGGWRIVVKVRMETKVYFKSHIHVI